MGVKPTKSGKKKTALKPVKKLSSTKSKPGQSSGHPESNGSHDVMIGMSREPIIIAGATTLKILACNAAACELYGYNEQELLARDLISLSPPRERALARTKLQRSSRGKKEFHHLRADDSSLFVEFDNTPFSYRGHPAFFCLIHDITVRSQLVRALLDSDASNREIIENASDIIYTHDLKGNFRSGNRAVTRLLGYASEEYLGKNIQDFVVPEDLEATTKAVSNKLAGGPANAPYSLRVFRKDKRVVTLEVSTRLIHRDGQPIGVQGVARDITGRQQMEMALRESEAKFRVMAESAPCGIVILQGSRLKYVNRTFVELTGRSEAELLGIEEVWNLAGPSSQEKIKQRVIARARGEHAEGHYEFTILSKNGEERWTDFTAANIQYEGALATVVMIFDVTERKRAEEEIRKSEEKYRQLFQRNLAGVFVSSLDGEFLDCNDSFAHICGFLSREEALQRSSEDFYVTKDERKEFIARLRRAKVLTNIEVRVKRKDGTPFWALENVVLLEGQNGAMDTIQGTMVDITERKQAEEALVESESKFRAVADTAASAIYIHNGRTFLYVNKASEIISGFSREELFSMPPFGLVHPDDRELVLARGRARTAGENAPERYEYRIRVKDGSTRWLDFSATTVQFEGETAILATAFDITERKLAESMQAALYRIADRANAVEDLQLFYAGIHEIVSELMYAKNFYVALFDEKRKTLSYPYYADELDEPPLGEYPLGKGRTEYVLRRAQTVLLTPEDFERLANAGEVELVGSNCVDWIGAPLQSGNQCFGVIVVQSYTKNIRYGEREREILNFVSQHLANAILRKRHEEALRESELKYRNMVQSAVYGIYRSSADDRFMEVNPAMVKMLEYDSAEELLALNLSRDVYADEGERELLIQKHGHAGLVDNVEVRWKRKNGKLITVRLSGRALHKPSGEIECFEMIAEDVTERRGLEDQLRQSQKMEAVGRLAGGVAHDFNNLLTVIKGYSELMLEEFKESDPLRPEMEEIKKAADRAATLTRQLLAFSRQQVLAPKVLDLNSIVSNMDKLLKRLIGSDIDLHTLLDHNVGRVKADPGQIEQVIMNLAVNARDAMPVGGKLTIETSNVELDDDYAREHMGASAGSFVMMAVSDSGMGMAESVRERIFEPFFTTKEAGKGTGLGLSTVYGIVKQSGGYIWVYSELNIGTTFKVYLPRVDAAPDSVVSGARAPNSNQGNETVLLVEDEDGVRALVRQVLHKHGYTVLEARDGAEALMHCERHKGEIELLLTDVVLEQMSGPELAKRLLGIRPNMRVLFISGYTDDAIIHHGVLAPGTAFLQKPFTTEALTRKIRQILES